MCFSSESQWKENRQFLKIHSSHSVEWDFLQRHRRLIFSWNKMKTDDRTDTRILTSLAPVSNLSRVSGVLSLRKRGGNSPPQDLASWLLPTFLPLVGLAQLSSAGSFWRQRHFPNPANCVHTPWERRRGWMAVHGYPPWYSGIRNAHPRRSVVVYIPKGLVVLLLCVNPPEVAFLELKQCREFNTCSFLLSTWLGKPSCSLHSLLLWVDLSVWPSCLCILEPSARFWGKIKS